MIEQEIQRDVFDGIEECSDPVVFFHGCNTQGHMGAGVAKSVKERWPEEVYRPYHKKCIQSDDEELIGTVLWTPVHDGLTIANGFTQKNWGRMGGAKVGWIEEVLGNIDDRYDDEDSDQTFISVRVGAGLGGLEWEDIRPVFEQSSLTWRIYYL